MKRTMTIVAAFLMLLFAFSPQPILLTESAPPSQGEVRPSFDEISRHTRTTETTSAHRSVVVRSGDTYGRWATQHCGNFNAWPGIQATNKWPERRIPVGATATITCAAPTIVPVPAPPPVAKPTPKPATVSAVWVHPLASGRVGNSCYRTSSRPGHDGVDMAQPSGTPIRAVAAGTVHRRTYSGGAGHYIALRHADNIYTQYHHLRSASPLSVGSSVRPGQTIGYVGNTGNSTGPHLHFEVMRGGYGGNYNTSPGPFMRARSVNIGC